MHLEYFSTFESIRLKETVLKYFISEAQNALKSRTGLSGCVICSVFIGWDRDGDRVLTNHCLPVSSSLFVLFCCDCTPICFEATIEPPSVVSPGMGGVDEALRLYANLVLPFCHMAFRLTRDLSHYTQQTCRKSF